MSTKNYKRIEIEIRELVAGGRRNIYEIATRCVTLLNDSGTYALAIGIKPDEVIEHLDGYLKDFAVNLESVVTLLSIFPNEAQWNKPLLDLLEEAEALIRQQKADQRREEEGHVTPTRHVIKRAEYEEVVKDRDSLKAETTHWREEALRLKAENDQLKMKCAELQGEVRALRKHPEPVAA